MEQDRNSSATSNVDRSPVMSRRTFGRLLVWGGLVLTACSGSLNSEQNNSLVPNNEFAYTASGVTDLAKDGDPQELLINDAIYTGKAWVNIPTRVLAQKWNCNYDDPDSHKKVQASIYEVTKVEKVYSGLSGLQSWKIDCLSEEVQKDPKLATGEDTMTIAFRGYKTYPLSDNPNPFDFGNDTVLIVSSREN